MPTNSFIVSQILKYRRDEAEMWGDYRLFNPPSECAGLIAQQQRDFLTELLKELGITPWEYNEMLDSLISPKYSYTNQLYINPDEVNIREFPGWEHYSDYVGIGVDDVPAHLGRPCYWH